MHDSTSYSGAWTCLNCECYFVVQCSCVSSTERDRDLELRCLDINDLGGTRDNYAYAHSSSRFHRSLPSSVNKLTQTPSPTCIIAQSVSPSALEAVLDLVRLPSSSLI